MTNMIRRTLLGIKGGPEGAGIFVFKKNKPVGGGRLYIERKSYGAANNGSTVFEPIATDRVNVLGTSVAALTLDGTDDGATVIANNSAATVVLTLPRTTVVGPGFVATLLVGVLPGAGAGTTLTPNANDKFAGNGFNAKTAGQTLVNSAATDAVGDLVTVQSDGAGVWYVISKVGTWA